MDTASVSISLSLSLSLLSSRSLARQLYCIGRLHCPSSIAVMWIHA